jgi:A/G-specific adenine glycosylase
MTKSFNFADALLDWFDHHGRKNLPWQQNPTPYHVWLSEIMLQQTQVATVIDYYNRFIHRFPDVQSLAKAKQDDVLAYWSGLGYYARARNLHKTAQIVSEEYTGRFPKTLEELINLPGIGRSTAGAILTLGYHQKYPILDGNVKRVLTRFFAISGWPGNKKVEDNLWQKAESLLPDKRIANYIQAQMDLGATLCTRSKPDCPHCPLQSHCLAYNTASPTDYPEKKPKKTIPTRTCYWLVCQNGDELFLEQRPSAGIWGGLWSFPERQEKEELIAYCERTFHFSVDNIEQLPELTHVFSHFKLTIRPLLITSRPKGVTDKSVGNWYKIDDIMQLGLPAPVRSFLHTLQ